MPEKKDSSQSASPNFIVLAERLLRSIVSTQSHEAEHNVEYQTKVKELGGDEDWMIAASFWDGTNKVYSRIRHLEIVKNPQYVRELAQRSEDVYPEEERELDKPDYYWLKVEDAIDISVNWDPQTDPYGLTVLDILMQRDNKGLRETLLLKKPSPGYDADANTVLRRIDVMTAGERFAIDIYKSLVQPQS